MKIAQVSPAEERVPPVKYGGTERIVSQVTEGLLSNGHDVTLLASGDSVTNAELFPISPRMVRGIYPRENTKLLRAAIWKSNLVAIEYLATNNFEIIHNHIGWPLLVNNGLYSSPIVTTLHGEQNEYRRHELGWYKDLPFISISNSQRKNAPDLNYVATIYNGVDLKELTYVDKSGDYLAFLGRTTPEKGLKEAIDFAISTKTKLKIAAKIEPLSQEYFDSLKPLIDGKLIEYVGEIDTKERNDFLGGAKALCAFINWDEPFGLFMVEAMACGVPVIAFNKGSVPEIIQDGKTGFIVNNLDEAIRAWKRIEQINRRDCRQLVETRFTIEKMVENYERVFEQIISKSKKTNNSKKSLFRFPWQ